MSNFSNLPFDAAFGRTFKSLLRLGARYEIPQNNPHRSLRRNRSSFRGLFRHLQALVDTSKDAVRNSESSISALASSLGMTPVNDSGLVLEEATDRVSAQGPHCGDLKDGVMVLRWIWGGILDRPMRATGSEHHQDFPLSSDFIRIFD
jgi:hypothetical protein